MGGVTPRNSSASGGGSGSRRTGCLSSGGILLLVIFLIVVVGHPWALHMGGRWTPAMVWHGYGKMHSSNGAEYLVWMNIGPMAGASRRARKGENFQGTMILCPAQGSAVTLDVFGHVAAWVDADGKEIKMVVASQRGAPAKVSFRMSGAWRGGDLVLEDGGSLADFFRADGSAKGLAPDSRGPQQVATVIVRYAQQSEFEASCRGGQSKF